MRRSKTRNGKKSLLCGCFWVMSSGHPCFIFLPICLLSPGKLDTRLTLLPFYRFKIRRIALLNYIEIQRSLDIEALYLWKSQSGTFVNYWGFFIFFLIDNFTIEPHNLPIDNFCAVQKHWSNDLTAGKLRIVLSGSLSPTWQTLSQFWSFKIRRTTFLNNIKFDDLLILKLRNCEMVRRAFHMFDGLDSLFRLDLNLGPPDQPFTT